MKIRTKLLPGSFCDDRGQHVDCRSTIVRFVGLFFSAAALSAATAAPALAETLNEVMAATFLGNPALEAERSRQQADEENVRQAVAGWLPTVNLDAEAGHERSDKQHPLAKDRLSPQGYGLTLSQPLFEGFRTLNGTRKAQAEARAGYYQLGDKEQSVLLDAVTAYADVLRDRQIWRRQRENVRYLQSELAASRKRFEKGDLTKTDVAQARTRVHEGKADLAQANAERLASEARFAAVVGHQPGRLSKPHVPRHLLPRTLEEAKGLAEEQNPRLESTRHRHEAARREKLQAYGELLPTVSLDLEYDYNDGHSTTIDQQEDASVFVRLKMPLYQGGAVRSKIRQARARQTGRRYEISDSRRKTVASVIDAWHRARAARERVSAARLQVSSARAALKGVKIEVKVGERAFFEVLDAQRELVNAQVDMARAERDLVVAEFAMLAAVGRLTASELGLPVADETPRPPVHQRSEQGGWKPVTVATKMRPAPSLFAETADVQEAKGPVPGSWANFSQ